MNRLIKHVISLVKAKFSPHICTHTFFPMTWICALWLWDRFRFVFLSVFPSPQKHHLKFLEAIQRCYETPHPLSTSGILAVFFFFLWHKNNQKRIQMPGQLPKRDIKVLPILFVNHHDLLILTCCYQKNHLSSQRIMEVIYLGEGGVWVPQLQKYCCIISENG